MTICDRLQLNWLPGTARSRLAALASLAALFLPGIALPATNEIVLRNPSYLAMETAIAEARAHFDAFPSDTVEIRMPAGEWDFTVLPEGVDPRGLIDVSKVAPGADGKLRIVGAGRDLTVVELDQDHTGIYGRETYRVEFADFTMTRPRMKVSQGRVASAAPGKVVLDIPPGFPSPADIFNPDPEVTSGRYLREYVDQPADPHILPENNRQVPWDGLTNVADPLHPRRWEIILQSRKSAPDYAPGDLIGIKSKHGGTSYRFLHGADITFRSIRWVHNARGVFRNVDRVSIIDCVIDRAPEINGERPALSTPGGGPQIGQPSDSPVSGHTVTGNVIIGTGDDSIACFNCTDSVISDNYVRDSFVRGIFLYRPERVEVKNNTLIRAPLSIE